jgi:hypothetical protein
MTADRAALSPDTRRRMGDAIADAVVAAITDLAEQGRQQRMEEEGQVNGSGLRSGAAGNAREPAGMRGDSGNWRCLDVGTGLGDAAPGLARTGGEGVRVSWD